MPVKLKIKHKLHATRHVSVLCCAQTHLNKGCGFFMTYCHKQFQESTSSGASAIPQSQFELSPGACSWRQEIKSFEYGNESVGLTFIPNFVGIRDFV
jgi:hypothetical protein